VPTSSRSPGEWSVQRRLYQLQSPLSVYGAFTHDSRLISCVLCSLFVSKLTHFYDLKSKVRAWEEDLRWIRRVWSDGTVDIPSVELFAMESRSSSPTADGSNGEHNQACADQVISKFEHASLATRFFIPQSTTSIQFAEVVGYVARNCWLNDSCVNLCIQAICSAKEGCLAFNSLIDDTTGMRPPVVTETAYWDEPLVAEISAYSYFVMPVNIRNTHWVVLIVNVSYRAGTMTVFFYDPMGPSCSELEDKWEERLLPFVRRWHDSCALQWRKANDNPNVSNWTLFDFPKVTKVWLKTPTQPDSSSCGVMIIAQVYSIVNELGGFGAGDEVSRDYVAIMRLRTLWMLLCYMDQVNPRDAKGYKKVHKELAHIYGKKNSSVWRLQE
jgi:hypothetical protein